MTQTQRQTLTIYGGMDGVRDGDLFKAVTDSVEGRTVLKLEKVA